MHSAVIFVIALVAGVLGYGWWHNHHATFHMSLTDKTSGGQFGHVFNAELAFLDAAGNVLARGKTDGKFGVVLVAHPSAGYCSPDLQPEAYRTCLKAQSEWLTTWAPGLRYVDLVAGQCRLQRVPLQIAVYRDNVFSVVAAASPYRGETPYVVQRGAGDRQPGLRGERLSGRSASAMCADRRFPATGHWAPVTGPGICQ